MPPHPGSTSFDRRPDRSLGWAFLESRQARALAERLSRGRAPGPETPEFLLPFPASTRRPIQLRIILRSIGLVLLVAQGGYMIATLGLIAAYRHVDPPATVLMAYRKWGYGWKLEAPRALALRRVPSYLRRMLVAIEDDKFFEHHGLDFEAFARAREINARLGKPLYGGSTLTMQVARTLFLVPEKSYLRKYLEIVAALELELLLPKERILELYFGYAEWGKGIFGIEAASRRWYGKSVAALSRDEAARLIALLSSPIKYRPDTVERNGILRERYRYLARRYAAATGLAELNAPAPPLETEPPPSPEPEAIIGEVQVEAPSEPLSETAPDEGGVTEGEHEVEVPIAPITSP